PVRQGCSGADAAEHSGRGRRARPPDTYFLSGRLRGSDRPGGLRRNQGSGCRHDAADRAGAFEIRHPLRVDCSGHLLHADGRLHERGAAGFPRQPDPLPQAPRQTRGVRATGRRRLRDSDAERRDRPARRRRPHAAHLTMNASAPEQSIQRDVMEYDVVIVGAGPAGLACAIRLKQLQHDLNVCVLEKAAAVGAHALSGAVIEPGPLDALAPEWRDSPPEICVPAVRDEFRLLTAKGSMKLPLPPQLHNRGNFIISLGLLTPWLARKAESLGVDVFPGFAAAAPLVAAEGVVAGVQLGDMGLDKDGKPGPNFTPGAEVRARTTVVAEGARGSLAKQLIRRFSLDARSSPQSYGLGMKELWQLPQGRVQPGLVQHTLGWPLDSRTYGGSFIYHLDKNRVYVGFVVGLDYEDPRLKPFEAFQQFKHHPQVRPLLEGGEILAAGARTIAAGGWQSIPRLEMPGAMLIGDSGGG